MLKLCSRALVLGWALLGLLACGGPPPPADLPLHTDLAAAFPEAELHREVGLLDLGTSAARPHLGAGWSWDETTPDGTTFVWGLAGLEGGRSELTFFLAAPRALLLSFRAFPFSYAGAPPQAVTLWVNGETVLEVELEEGPDDYGIEIPRELLVAGENHLAFSYRWSRVPAEAGLGADTRRLAVGWDWIQLDGGALEREGAGVGETRAELRAQGDLLFLPYGSQVDYYLRLPSGAELAVDEIGRRGGEGQLEVWVARDRPRAAGAEEERIFAGEWGGGARRWRLADASLLGTSSGLLRLSLRAIGGVEGTKGAGGIALRGARILAPIELVEPVNRTENAGSRADALPAPPAVAGTQAGIGREPGVNLIIYLVDTLRADRLGVYGGERGLTPRLDAFAEGALVFENAIASSSWTKPSVASLFTGLDPLMHGVQQPEDGLPERAPLLAELLRRGGYRTAALVSNAHITEESGFARGFDTFETLFVEPNDALTLLGRAEALLADQLGADDATRPFFLYLHTIDPHAPYQPPEDFRRRFAPEVEDPSVGSFESIRAIAAGKIPRTARIERDLAVLYDAEVAQADAGFGALLDTLERLDLRRTTAILFLSDHGEAFYEHGVMGHGWDLYNEVLHVPLLLALPPDWSRDRRVGDPGGAARRVPTLATHTDLLPTLLGLARQPVPEGLPGRDLLHDRPEPAEELEGPPVFSHQDYEGRAGASLALGLWHLIEPLNGRFAPTAELYDRLRDPAERRDLMREHPVLGGYLRRLLREHLREAETLDASTVDLDAETRRQLEALGYLNR